MIARIIGRATLVARTAGIDAMIEVAGPGPRRAIMVVADLVQVAAMERGWCRVVLAQRDDILVVTAAEPYTTTR